MTQVTYHDGGIIGNVHVVLIFWGSYWEGGNPNPSVQTIRDAVSSMVTGTYMTSLSQYSTSSPYQQLSTGLLYATFLVTSSLLNSPADPPNPFTNDHITTLVSNCIYTNNVPSPSEQGAGDNQMLYCVILPPNWTFKDPQAVGEHGSYTYYAPPLYWHLVRYAWVTQGGGSLDILTSIFSHELAEACTDPDATGWYQDPGPDQNEIGDLCYSFFGRLDNNIEVQSYWSNADNGCVIPTQKSVKDSKDSKDTKENKDVIDNKGRKENKDSKEKDRDAFNEQPWIKIEFPPSAGEAERPEPKGHAFIRPEERPAVGEQALVQAQDVEE